MQTERVDSSLVELSADMFTTKQPGALKLCEDLGIADTLIGTNDQFRRSFVVRDGRLISTPSGLVLMQPTKAWPILASPLMSVRGRLRMMGEWFVRKKTEGDTSLEEFATRRFGVEAFQRLIQPMVGGIYTADPKKLSVQATMPQFLEMERQHGSLVAAAWKQLGKREKTTEQASGARYSAFMAPRGGMQALIDALESRLQESGTTIHLNSPVRDLQRDQQRWRVITEHGESDFDGVIVATPAFIAANILRNVDTTTADLLREIPYASAAVAIFLLDRKQIRHPLNGFGFVVPATENMRILAGSFTSVKFAGRAADDQLLLRVFMGGAVQPQLLKQSDDELQQIALREVALLLGIDGEPIWGRLQRWTEAMPQYHVGHVQHVAKIDARIAQLPGLELAGNAYHGVGIPFCAAGGYRAAEQLMMAGDV